MQVSLTDFCIENLRLGADVNQLAAAAVTRLQGELAKDGREPSVSSKKMHDKSSSGNAAVLRPPDKARGRNLIKSCSFFIIPFWNNRG